ncbi:MAG TPA: GAF domain-containing protein [Ktedonobacteraceae bacterium]|nr:GAF domain-containing protein [Ktedonobacteraceae bacterium]
METRTRPPTQEQSAIVERVAHIVSRVRGAKPDYARLAAELEPAIPFDVFGIVLLRHDKVAVRVVVCTHESDGWIAHYHQHPFKDSMFENILQRCKSPSVENPGEKSTHTEASHVQDLTDIEIRNYPEGLDGPPAVSGDALSGRPYLHSTLIAPLVVGDQAIGSLELGSTRIDAYAGEALQRLISAVAHVLAAAIESAQIGGSVEIQDRQREELKSVSKALASEMDLTMILNRIVGGIAKALDVSSAIITLDQQRGNLKMVVQYGLDRHILEKIAASEADLGEQAIIGATLLRRQPHFSNDIAEDGRFPASQIFASQLGIRSIFCFPLVSGSSVYGALLLCSAEPGGFTPLKLDILSLFASHATIAIHNGMLLESARERRRFQEAIEQLDTVALHQSVSNEDELILLKKVREASKQIFGVSLNSLLRFISDHLLTSSERDLQKILQAVHDEQESIAANSIKGTEGLLLEEQKAAALIETAEAALVQAGLLGDVNVALAPVLTQLYERIRSQMTTPWFVIDRGGNCVYANPAAEVFCGMSIGLERLGNLASLQHPSQVADNDVFDIDWYNVSWSFEKQRYFDTYLTYSQNSSITLLDAFTNLFSRIRNGEDVRRYLDDFSQVELASDDMANVVWQRNIAQLEFSPTSRFRFVIAAEPLQDRVHPHYQIDSEITGEKESKFIAAVPTAKEPRNRFSESQTMLPNSAPSDRHYQFVCFSLYDAQDHHLGYALQIGDITEQVRDEKNKAVLLSTVSHDLRTPLTAIKAAVTGLLQPGITWDGQLLHEILEDVDIETDHLLSQISSFIEMSRIDMGALTLEKEWCDIMEIVHSIQADERRLLVGHPVRIDRPTQLPMVYVDFVQIKRVLRCLLENAVHHSPEHAEIVIAVDTMHVGDQDMIWTEDSHNYLRVRVIDQGPGIPDGEQERIFKTFYSLDAQGSGLGLAISRGIVEAHQGRIRVEPVVSRGSCFTFVLPIS